LLNDIVQTYISSHYNLLQDISGDATKSSAEKNAVVESEINKQIQVKEYEVMAAVDWNLHQGTGAEVFSGLLKAYGQRYSADQVVLQHVSKLVRSFALPQMFFMNQGHQ
jgi:hypothetical protein